MLRPCFQAPLQERLVVNGKVDAEASGRGGKYRKKEPALPIIERPGWPKNERDEEDSAEYALDSGFSIKRFISRTVHPTGLPAVPVPTANQKRLTVIANRKTLAGSVSIAFSACLLSTAHNMAKDRTNMVPLPKRERLKPFLMPRLRLAFEGALDYLTPLWHHDSRAKSPISMTGCWPPLSRADPSRVSIMFQVERLGMHWRITQDEYDKKARELKERQTEIGSALFNITIERTPICYPGVVR